MNTIMETDSILEMYLLETGQMVEDLEEAILNCETDGTLSMEAINNIFRYMHTVKGSSAMMNFNEISSLAHAIEDLFAYLREKQDEIAPDMSKISDLILEGIDFTKVELEKIRNKDEADGNAQEIICNLRTYLEELKIGMGEFVAEDPLRVSACAYSAQKQNEIEQEQIKEQEKQTEIPSELLGNLSGYRAKIFFSQGCGMENVRAYSFVGNLQEIAYKIEHSPADLINDEKASQKIVEDGLVVTFLTEQELEEIRDFIQNVIYLEKFELEKFEEKDSVLVAGESVTYTTEPSFIVENTMEVSEAKVNDSKEQSEPVGPTFESLNKDLKEKTKAAPEKSGQSANQSFINVNVEKLDKLMDLVGEMVVTKAMVIQNPEVNKLEIESFQKASSQLQKITSELQDMVMSIRMVPISTTFMKMQRIVRDMSKKLDKRVKLEVIGEETEVDKNIVEKISDPLMHLIRNAIDHGLESPEERLHVGKTEKGTVVLEAKNVGSEVIVTIRDDGKGLNKKTIYSKAKEKGLVVQSFEQMDAREIYNLILLPGFSTKTEVTEFSGRGVGMDVVSKNIEMIGGTVFVDSTEGEGTTISLKIPLTLAIIDGMNIQVGQSKFTIPITSIKESFRPTKENIYKDVDGNEMIKLRGSIYPIVRLHDLYKVKTEIADFTEGILIMLEADAKIFCLFADYLIGEQQVVVKSMPNYIKKFKKIGGIGGCTLLGDGSISLIIDAGEIGSIYI